MLLSGVPPRKKASSGRRWELREVERFSISVKCEVNRLNTVACENRYLLTQYRIQDMHF